MALAGSEERAGHGSASVSAIHAPFATEVECKMALLTHPRIMSRMTLSDRTRCSGCCLPSRLKIDCRILAELQMRLVQLAREGSPPPGLRLPRTEYHVNPIR
jgi:hypothetical protein